MTAPQPEPGPQPDYAALDRRLRAVEHRQDHELTQEIAATGEAVRLLHGGVREVDRAVTRVGQRLDQVEAEVGAVARSQVEHGAALAQVAGKVDGLDHKVDGLAGRVGGLEHKVDGLDHKVDGLSGRVGGLEHKVDGLAEIGTQNAGALAQQGGQVEALQRDVAGVMGLQEEHGRLLAEILRRLPAAGE